MITYNAGRFEVLQEDYWSKDPMDRGPLVIRDWNPMYLSSVPCKIQYYYTSAVDIIDDIMVKYNKPIGQVTRIIDPDQGLVEVMLW